MSESKYAVPALAAIFGAAAMLAANSVFGLSAAKFSETQVLDIAKAFVNDTGTREVLLGKMSESGKFIGPKGDKGAPGPPGPVGAVVAWPSTSTLPDGWLKCDGRVLDATEFVELDSVLKKTYGDAGEGMVKLPNFSDFFLRGANADVQLGVPQQAQTGQPSGPGNTHVNDGYYRVSVARGTGEPFHRFDVPRIRRQNGEPHEGETSRAILWDDETRPKNYPVYWIIRVR